ncbi:MAG: hypothetical protein O2954_08575 [bacterium]|nr:hypothetical protein [bacterium]
MSDALKKIKRLEQYIAVANATVDPILDQTLGKLLAREIEHMHKLKSRLEAQIKAFEEKFGMQSACFYTQYNQGKLGDEMDFIEWASTIDMLKNTQKRLNALEQDV